MKSGLEYFPLDTLLDDKFSLIEAEFGLQGFAVIIKLYQKIYGQEGYYCIWNDEVALLFSRSCGLGGSAVSEIVSAALRRGIFNHEMYDKQMILTSEGIQKRYIQGAKRRDKIVIDKRYLLVNHTQLPKNVYINEENVCGNSKNVYGNEQSKVKESKVKYSKENNSAHTRTHVYGEYSNVKLTQEEYAKLCEEIPNLDKLIDELSGYIKSSGKIYKSHFATLRNWYRREREKAPEKSKASYDLNAYEQKAMNKKLEYRRKDNGD